MTVDIIFKAVKFAFKLLILYVLFALHRVTVKNYLVTSEKRKTLNIEWGSGIF